LIGQGLQRDLEYRGEGKRQASDHWRMLVLKNDQAPGLATAIVHKAYCRGWQRLRRPLPGGSPPRGMRGPLSLLVIRQKTVLPRDDRD
jgi:hypothetical protein